MTEPVAPIDWARHYAAQRVKGRVVAVRQEPAALNSAAEEMLDAVKPARHTIDTITPEALDQLHEDLEEARQAADRYYHNGLKASGAAGMRALDAEQRAKQAEAATARVRAALDRWALNTVMPQTARALNDIRIALDEPKDPRP